MAQYCNPDYNNSRREVPEVVKAYMQHQGLNPSMIFWGSPEEIEMAFEAGKLPNIPEEEITAILGGGDSALEYLTKNGIVSEGMDSKLAVLGAYQRQSPMPLLDNSQRNYRGFSITDYHNFMGAVQEQNSLIMHNGGPDRYRVSHAHTKFGPIIMLEQLAQSEIVQ